MTHPVATDPNEFNIGDAERILKSIFPQVGENPLGDILTQTLEIRGDQLAFEEGYDADQEQIREELSAIKSRTFGILILQIIRTIKTLLGLLPAARIILIMIAVITLVTTFMQKGSVSGGDISAAVEASGLGPFIRRQVQILNGVVEEQAERVETVIDLGTDVLRVSATKAEVVLLDLDFVVRELRPGGERSVEEKLDVVRSILQETRTQAADLANLTFNSDSLIMGALRTVPARIRSIPATVADILR